MLITWRGFENFIEARGGRFLQAGRNMAVSVERYLDAGVPQPFLDDLGMHSLFQHQRGMGMPCIVQPDIFKPGPLDHLAPGMGDAIRQKRLAVQVAEYQVIVL